MTRLHPVRAHVRRSSGPSYDDKLHKQLRKEIGFKLTRRVKAGRRELNGGRG